MSTDRNGPRVAYHSREKMFVVRGDDGRPIRLDRSGAEEVLMELGRMLGEERALDARLAQIKLLDTICQK